MPRDTATALQEFALESVGQSLRTIVVVFEADFEVEYLRDDLKDRYSATEYGDIVETFRTVPDVNEEFPGEHSIGPRRCLIHYHQNAFVFQFPHEGCHSILLSVEPTVGSRLEDFIIECQERI